MFDKQILSVILIDPLSAELFTSQRWLHHWQRDILFPMQVRALESSPHKLLIPYWLFDICWYTMQLFLFA